MSATIFNNEFIINGSTITSQISISLFHKLSVLKELAIRDIAYYKEKHQKIMEIFKKPDKSEIGVEKEGGDGMKMEN